MSVGKKSFSYDSVLTFILSSFHHCLASFTVVNRSYGDNQLTAKIQKPTKWIEIRQSQRFTTTLVDPRGLTQTTLFSKRSTAVIVAVKNMTVG